VERGAGGAGFGVLGEDVDEVHEDEAKDEREPDPGVWVSMAVWCCFWSFIAEAWCAGVAVQSRASAMFVRRVACGAIECLYAFGYDYDERSPDENASS
jgi:hypothetical protein